MYKEYSIIYDFYHNNNKYKLLLDDKNRYFFLKVKDNNTFDYLDINEFSEFVNIFGSIKLSMNIERKERHRKRKFKCKPLVYIGTALIPVTLALIVALNTNLISLDKYNIFDKYKNDNQTLISFDVEDSAEPLELDTYLVTNWDNGVNIYENDYLTQYLGYESVSKDEIIDVINNNKDISETFKPILFDYVNALYNKYPSGEYRAFYENLKTLKVVELTDDELLIKTLSESSSGCYVAKENAIYVCKDKQYKKGTWDYQVIFHELSHCLRTSNFQNKDGKLIKYQFAGYNYYDISTEEALNSIFAVSLFDYEENDIAYQLQSNYHKVMLECLDNYSIEDYTKHSLSWYARALDQYNGDNNYAITMFKLIEAQYKDYHDDEIKMTQDQFYPLYDYISDMYYKKYITNDMSYEDAKKVADSLVSKITFDVPGEFELDINHYYDYFDQYCSQIGITNSVAYTK